MTNTTIVQTCTSNLAQSIDYYQKLGFTLVSKNNPILFTDGKFLIEINPERTARIGLKIYQKNWAEKLEKLKQKTAIIPLENGYLLSDPNGVKVYLVEEEMSIDYKLTGQPQAIPGNFAGLSIEAVDVKSTITFWETLGYKHKMGSIEQGWLSMENGSAIGISIMKSLVCPHLFFNPGLTFFNSGKNPEIIQKIRNIGIPITEEISVFNKEGLVDNIIIADPSGLGFFIFND